MNTQNTTDNEPGEALRLIDIQDVLKAVSEFCDLTEPFVGERFKKQLRNAIRAVPRAPLAAPQGDAQIDPVNTYPTVVESVQLLEAAGFGAAGNPNTLLAMVKEAIAAASSSAPAAPPHQRKDGLYEYDLGDKVVVTRSPIPAEPLQPEGEQESLKKRARRIIDVVIASPCIVETRFFSQSEEQEKLENQVARLLAQLEREQLENEIFQDATDPAWTPPATPSAAAMRAAEEVAANYEVHKDHCHSNERYPSPPCDCGAAEEIAAIITRHLAECSDMDVSPDIGAKG